MGGAGVGGAAEQGQVVAEPARQPRPLAARARRHAAPGPPLLLTEVRHVVEVLAAAVLSHQGA